MGRPRRPPSPGLISGIRIGKVVLAALSALLLLAGLDVVVLDARVQHVTLTPTVGTSGQTWVVVGSDSRSDLPAGAAQASFGTTADVSGARADIVLIVHRTAAGRVTTVSVPRDLLLHTRSGQLNRLALTFDVGPQTMLDSLCATLGVPADHLVVVDFALFASVVDALHGISVDVPTPLRDRYSGLDLRTAGMLRLSGDQALALVRSRHTEHEIAGRWTVVPNGADQRTSWGGVVFAAIEHAATDSADPWLLQRLAWRVSGSIRTDAGTSLTGLAALAADGGQIVDLPVRATSGGLAVFVDDATRATLAAAGFDGSCH